MKRSTKDTLCIPMIPYICYSFRNISFSCYRIFHKLVLNPDGMFSNEFVDEPFLDENFIELRFYPSQLLNFQL